MSLFLASFLLAVAATTPARPLPPPDLANPPATAERLPDGLITLRVEAGSGAVHPTDADLVKLRYAMWQPDGKLLDFINGDLASVMAVSRMMPGWREATQMMVAGERRRIWIPAALGGGKIAAGTSLVIEAELLDVIPAPKTPSDVAAPPAEAERSRSGLAWKVLEPGSGDKHPGRRSTVIVNYSGWTTDGRLFDSTILHGGAVEIPLSAVIRGWTEGISMMTVGEKRRFWIPAALAYADQPDKPQGTLVFDVELVAIK